jgi:hypothetical protein
MYAGAAVLLRQHPSDCTFVRRYAKRSTTPRRRSPNFCARNAPWGNTTKNRQNNATLVSRDSGNARNGFYRSKGTYTRGFDVIPAKGAPYWPSIT